MVVIRGSLKGTIFEVDTKTGETVIVRVPVKEKIPTPP